MLKYIFLFVACSLQALETVPHVDLDRYMGKWYEIARLPNKHQMDCASNPVATYIKNDDGTYTLVHTCVNKDGSVQKVEAPMWAADATNAKLKVGVIDFPVLRSLFAVNYWIIYLTPDYSYAVVSEPKQKYLWILSRTSEFSKDQFDLIVAHLKEKGFTLDDLILTPHKKTND